METHYFCKMKIGIDPGAGPCFGVEKAIQMAETVLEEKQQLLCIGDLIHNDAEISRLENLGMKTIDLNEAIKTKAPSVLFRAHGEKPESFQLAKKNHINIIDATCPIVKKLQIQIEKTYHQLKNSNGQIVIFGSKSHPEIISLLGHCKGNAIIIENMDDIHKIDFAKPIYLFSQTTKYRSHYYQIKHAIENKIEESLNIHSSKNLIFHDSSCKIVAQRDEQLKEFIKDKDLIIFVSGKKSSNGRQLFQICRESNIPSYFISHSEEIDKDWFTGMKNIGISGATSTPYWLLTDVEKRILSLQ